MGRGRRISDDFEFTTLPDDFDSFQRRSSKPAKLARFLPFTLEAQSRHPDFFNVGRKAAPLMIKLSPGQEALELGNSSVAAGFTRSGNVKPWRAVPVWRWAHWMDGDRPPADGYLGCGYPAECTPFRRNLRHYLVRRRTAETLGLLYAGPLSAALGNLASAGPAPHASCTTSWPKMRAKPWRAVWQNGPTGFLPKSGRQGQAVVRYRWGLKPV